MMKRIIIALLLMSGFLPVFSQSYDTAKLIHYRTTYGQRMDRYKADKVLDIPTDTIHSKYGIARIGKKAYIGDGTSWTEIAGAAALTDTTYIKYPGLGDPYVTEDADTVFVNITQWVRDTALIRKSGDTLFFPNGDTAYLGRVNATGYAITGNGSSGSPIALDSSILRGDYIRNQYAAKESKSAWIDRLRADSIRVDNIAQGKIVYAGAGSVLQSSSSLHWDSINNRLGIGTSTPSFDVDIERSHSGGTYLRTRNTNSGGLAGFYVTGDAGNGIIQQVVNSASSVLVPYRGWGRIATDAGSNGLVFGTGGAGDPIDFAPNNSSAVRILDTANVLIQRGGTFTDNGYRLQILGNQYIKGISTAVPLQRIETLTGTAAVNVSGTGNVGLGLTNPLFQLHLSGSAPNVVLDRYSDNGQPPVIRGRKARGTSSSPTAVLTNDTLMYVDAQGYDGSVISGGAGFLMWQAAENWAAGTNRGSKFTIRTVSVGAINTQDRFTIDSIGGVRAHSTLRVGNAGIDPSLKFDVGGTDKASRPNPPMTTAQMLAISSPVPGASVYNTTENAVMTFDGTRWTGFRFNGTKFQGYESGSGTWVDLN